MNHPARTGRALAGTPRAPRRPVHGVLLLDKPAGLSSNHALQRAKRLLLAEKAGHTGTLDPMATGLLPLCFGAATKFAQALLDADKTYLATVRLGTTTDSGDATGEVLQVRPVHVGADDVRGVLDRFRGEILQIPPMHSALKHAGRPLYELARQGIEIDRPSRQVRIHALDMTAWDDGCFTLRVHCSKGTYIRTLAQDLGQALGCGAHLTGLRRLSTAGLSLEQGIDLEALEALDEPARARQLLPPDVLLASAPAVRLDAQEAGRFLTGLRRRGDWPDAAQVRVYGPQPGAFLGSAHVTRGELIPDRLLSPVELSQLLAQQLSPDSSVPAPGGQPPLSTSEP